MSFVGDILADLGLGGATLEHIQTASATVQPGAMDAMADLFDAGSKISGDGSTRLNAAIHNVVAGWKGQAADAASTQVLTTSRTTDELGSSSTTAAQNAREYASTVRGLQTRIAAIPKVDTSMAKAVHAAGGPIVAAFNPGAVGQQMLAAQLKADQHRDQAASLMREMDSHGGEFAERQSTVYPHANLQNRRNADGLPGSLSVEPVHGPEHGGSSGSRVRSVTSGSSGVSSTYSGGSGHGSGHSLSGFRDPSGNGTHTPTPKAPRSGSGGGPVHGAPVLPDPRDHTPIAWANPPGGGSTGAPPPPASSLPPVEGGSNVGLLGGLAAGGGALAAAGGLAGGRGAAFAGGRGGSVSGRGAANGESFERAGRGAVTEGARPGIGGGANEPALRTGTLSSAAAGESAAGNRGFLPPGGAGARGSGDDDGELKRRPDYLVESDEIWGDGRLAAPPVLG